MLKTVKKEFLQSRYFRINKVTDLYTVQVSRALDYINGPVFK